MLRGEKAEQVARALFAAVSDYGSTSCPPLLDKLARRERHHYKMVDGDVVEVRVNV